MLRCFMCSGLGTSSSIASESQFLAGVVENCSTPKESRLHKLVLELGVSVVCVRGSFMCLMIHSLVIASEATVQVQTKVKFTIILGSSEEHSTPRQQCCVFCFCVQLWVW